MREAAVATIITIDPIPEVLVLKRSNNPRDPWSGQYAFPGGRRDHQDHNLLDTCVRETYEECGIELPSTTLIKEYPVRKAGSHIGTPTPVTTYLFELPHRPQITLQEKEISAHEWLRLDYVADDANIVRRPMSPRCPQTLFPCIPASLGFVWGFTFEALMMVISDRYALNTAAATQPPH
ncbi:NUDIX hydrolase [Desulfogranum mediterraneum]|uniref:NUDIX hydrolase n=1 Tax=Desulfogranum mediterraneum TaxID=160661 RepID=UPI000409BA3B|nr:NUDIX domain-containing protein [Desulfogranum mediterraneum]